jgi:hypothetical protein
MDFLFNICWWIFLLGSHVNVNGEHRLVHISGDFGQIKDNTAFCDLPNYVSCITQKILMSSFTNSNQ